MNCSVMGKVKMALQRLLLQKADIRQRQGCLDRCEFVPRPGYPAY